MIGRYGWQSAHRSPDLSRPQYDGCVSKCGCGGVAASSSTRLSSAQRILPGRQLQDREGIRRSSSSAVRVVEICDEKAADDDACEGDNDAAQGTRHPHIVPAGAVNAIDHRLHDEAENAAITDQTRSLRVKSSRFGNVLRRAMARCYRYGLPHRCETPPGSLRRRRHSRSACAGISAECAPPPRRRARLRHVRSRGRALPPLRA